MGKIFIFVLLVEFTQFQCVLMSLTVLSHVELAEYSVLLEWDTNEACLKRKQERGIGLHPGPLCREGGQGLSSVMRCSGRPEGSKRTLGKRRGNKRQDIFRSVCSVNIWVLHQ